MNRKCLQGDTAALDVSNLFLPLARVRSPRREKKKKEKEGFEFVETIANRDFPLSRLEPPTDIYLRVIGTIDREVELPEFVRAYTAGEGGGQKYIGGAQG